MKKTELKYRSLIGFRKDDEIDEIKESDEKNDDKATDKN
jgi:hypothetical protein